MSRCSKQDFENERSRGKYTNVIRKLNNTLMAGGGMMGSEGDSCIPSLPSMGGVTVCKKERVVWNKPMGGFNVASKAGLGRG